MKILQKKPTILIVDDEEDLRDAIAFDFERKNYNVLTAANGRDAFKLVESHKIDVVLSDVRMPDGDGVELLETIKTKHAFLPVVMFITGFSDLSLEQAYNKGADAVFSKPFDRQALFDAVTRALMATDQRYARSDVRIDITLPVGLKLISKGITLSTKVQNLGRGGIFVYLEKDFPELGDTCEFHLEGAGDLKIKAIGTGIVRWRRTQSEAGFASGCGIEFVQLEPGSLKQIFELINFLKTKSFIPNK
jgi:CheY-like chemotaxis protein